MTVDRQLEHLYQQIELIRGIGQPRSRRLCIMSFVAFLSGEAHTDNPSTTSSLIRGYAMVVNDEMPDSLRQRLKVFAPRLIGTNDGEDPTRAQILAEAVRTEIFPQLMTDFGLHPSPIKEAVPAPPVAKHHKHAARLQDQIDKVARLLTSLDPCACDGLASELAKLISLCGRASQGDGRGEWYWLKAIDLLDRLCDVAGALPRPTVQPERLASIEAFFCNNDEAQSPFTGAAGALARLRNLIPAFMR